MFGNPETTTGGRALKFYTSVRIDIRKIASIKEGDKVIGNRTKVKVVKNKMAAPFRICEFDIIYGEGISREGDLLDLGLDKGLIQKSGTWWSFGDMRIGQGRENARMFVRENPDVRDALEVKLRQALGLVRIPAAPENSPAATPGNGARTATPPPSAGKGRGSSGAQERASRH